jgi:hypothetical protein
MGKTRIRYPSYLQRPFDVPSHRNPRSSRRIARVLLRFGEGICPKVIWILIEAG